ncbi:hypothetical protein EVA_10577 [gut metagenome]|uniref:Uncharacterized protein n=1 Tax=gut metagenome TaxID=749906 RepID=J9GN62_9ZZZZ
MVEEKFSFHIRCYDTQFVHPLFRCTLHITFITHPSPSPSSKIDSKRKRSAQLTIFIKLKFYLLVLRLLIVYPHNECRQIQIFTGRILILKFQIALHSKNSSRLEGPAQTLLAVLVMFITNAQVRNSCFQIGRSLWFLKREQTLILHNLSRSAGRPQRTKDQARFHFPFQKIHHLFYLRFL